MLLCFLSDGFAQPLEALAVALKALAVDHLLNAQDVGVPRGDQLGDLRVDAPEALRERHFRRVRDVAVVERDEARALRLDDAEARRAKRGIDTENDHDVKVEKLKG